VINLVLYIDEKFTVYDSSVRKPEQCDIILKWFWIEIGMNDNWICSDMLRVRFDLIDVVRTQSYQYSPSAINTGSGCQYPHIADKGSWFWNKCVWEKNYKAYLNVTL